MEGLQHRLPAALDDRPDDALKLGARELVLEMKRPGRPGGEERQCDPGRGGGGEFNLGDFAGLPKDAPNNNRYEFGMSLGLMV